MLRLQSLSLVAISFRSSVALNLPLNGHMRYFSIKEAMNRRNPAFIDLSLTRVQSLLSRLGSPQHRFPIIHIAGTNGKGSTVSYLSSLLQRAIGLRVGTFTSPHLVEERDACQLDGKSIDVEIWQKAKRMVFEISNDSEEANQCTPFETLTATALIAFSLVEREQKPEILIIEVGMGGALDATNVFNEGQVLASVITAIDFDHQAFLGNSLKEISQQKAGIIKTNGLCILADQRRKSRKFDDDDGDDDDERDATKILACQSDHHHKEEQEIIETIRVVSFERNARLVYAQIPWRRLTEQQADQSETWSIHTIANIRYSPTLYASRKGDFCARIGDHLVPGPCIRLPATRASMMGAFVALQTLWSIARDENPCVLDMNGSDENEEVRLRIAFGLRDNPMAKEVIENCIASCHLAGRAEWKSLSLGGSSDSMMQVDDQQNQQDILTLVDGAHNPAAAMALREYVDSCIHAHLPSSSITKETTITVTWILAFSRGKAIEEMANNLLSGKGDLSKISTLENRLADISIKEHSISSSKVQVRNRIALIPFSTPVEGMPWVQCVPPEEAVKYFTKRDDVEEVLPFTDLTSALRWASQSGKGRVDDKVSNMIVIAGSLYLVSDVHRLL